MHALLAVALLAHRPHDDVASLAGTADGRILFAAVRSILYASGDGGETWKLSNRGLPMISSGYDKRFVPSTTVILSPTFTEDLTAVFEVKYFNQTRSGLFATRDGGLNWFQMENAPGSDPRARMAIAISSHFAQDHVMLIAGEEYMLYRSVDSGRSFQPVEKLGCTALKAVERAMFCGTVEGGLYWTGTGGASWREVPLASENGTEVTSLVELPGPIPGVPPASSYEVTLLVSTITSVLIANIGRDTGTLTWQKRVLDTTGLAISTGYIGNAIYVVEQSHKKPGLVKVSRDGGSSWAEDGAVGLHRHSQDVIYDTPSFNLFTSCPQANRAYLASFTGIYRREGNGPWVHLETIAQIITTLSVGAENDGLLSLNVCTMAGGCFDTNFDPRLIDSLPPDGLPSHTIRRWDTALGPGKYISDQYNMAKHSPNYANDGILLRSSSTGHMVIRSEDFGFTWSRISTPLIQSRHPMVVHTIEFSPSFAMDATVFIAGFNLGVIRSSDKGKTFEQLWAMDGYNTKVSISPRFGVGDRAILAMLTPMLPEDFARLDTDYASIDFGAYGKRTADHELQPELHMSDDAGVTWRQVGVAGSWRAAYFAHGAIVAHKGKDIVVNVSAPTVGAYEWCTLPLHAYTKQRTLGFGRGSLAVSPDFDLTQEIAVGWPEGGMLMAQVKRLPNGLCDASIRTVAKPEPDVTASRTLPWSFVHTIPPDNSARVGSPLVQFSPRYASDGVVFGASFYSVMASTDGGTNWRVLFSLNHTRTSCSVVTTTEPDGKPATLNEGCELCQGSFNYMGSEYFEVDRGVPYHYCLKCEPQHSAHRNAATSRCTPDLDATFWAGRRRK